MFNPQMHLLLHGFTTWKVLWFVGFSLKACVMGNNLEKIKLKS